MVETAELSQSGIKRTRGINYHGNLGRILRDLTGFATLASELVQNADDAKAKFLRFDIGSESLTIYNDAEFSNCDDQDLSSEECPFRATEGHRCDFHSFRDVASGDKADREGTTGAFGIGFTAVYQVADTATLISSGLRWEIDEMQAEADRIIEFHAPDSEGTTVVLPWATDPNSPFRTRFQIAAVTPEDRLRLLDILVTSMPTAMLFLRHVRKVELSRDGKTFREFHRVDVDDICEITAGDQPMQWFMLKAEFDEAAAGLRSQYPGKIDEKRGSAVTVAVALNADVDGLLCAYLPTDERSGLPAHINADFYPESDRKHLIVDGLHGQWNRLAVRAAALALTERLADLADLIGPEKIWALVFAAYEAKPSGRDTGIQAFWEVLEPRLPTTRVMRTTVGTWTTPESAVFLYSNDEDEVIPVLEQLGLQVMHPAVGSYVRRMTGRAGARQLSIGILATAMLSTGLTEATDFRELPAGLDTHDVRQVLWREWERLLVRPTSPDDRSLVRGLPLLPGTDGLLWPPEQLKVTDHLTEQIIMLVDLDVPLLDGAALPKNAEQLISLCERLDVRSLLNLLSCGEGPSRLQQALQSGTISSTLLLSWLTVEQRTIFSDPDVQHQVRDLAIYPTGNGFMTLDDAVLPGGFTDRLGIAKVIDRDKVLEHTGLLERLGAEPLTRITYLTQFVPRAASNPEMLKDPRWRQLIIDLATKIDEFADNPEIRDALSPLPLVATSSNGELTYLPAASAYFAGETVRRVLGPEICLAIPVRGHERATSTLYEWLGVAKDPRLPDLVRRAKQLSEGDADRSAREAVGQLVAYMGKLVPDRRTPAPDALSELQVLDWLPARNDASWHRPDALNSVFREVLFATQGRFLDIPQPVQQRASDFLQWLGVERNPSVAQVVAHLLACVHEDIEVNTEVYPELNRHSDDPAIGRLIDAASLLMPDGRYVHPAAVFRQDNPFGRFRQLLGPEFDAVGNLLDRLGVKRVPDHEDALDVLLDLADEEQHRFNSPIEEPEDLAVVWTCWRILDQALARGAVNTAWFATLHGKPVIPNASNVMTNPSRLLIDDMPGVANALNVGDSIIRRREGMWRAFAAAGVRSVTDAVTVDILDIEVTTETGAVRERLLARQRALARVLDEDAGGVNLLIDTLGRLSFPETPALRVRYNLSEFGVPPVELAPAAAYLPADPNSSRPAQLISCPQGNDWPWLPIAKELARALYPGNTPGSLASSLYLALTSPTLEGAHNALDEAGWPRLDHIEIVPVPTEPIARFGGDTTPVPTADHREHEATETDPGRIRHDTAAGARTDASDDSDTETAVDDPAKVTTTEGSSDGRASEGEKGHSDSVDGQPAGTSGTGEGSPPRRTTPPSAQRARRGRLRSYVVPDTASEDESSDQSTTVRSDVDLAGVQRVVMHERGAGRFPEVMPHHNPGFDIRSTTADGEVGRYIEVKSTGGLWDDFGVGLSRPQFNFGRDHRETFWLYVVEHALDDDLAQVHRIADPTNRVEEFRYDNVWSALGEGIEADPPAPEGVVSCADAPGPGWVPLRSLREDLTANLAPESWIEPIKGDPKPGSYAVQVLGRALEPQIERGAVLLVEPIDGPPVIGSLVVVQLESALDRDGHTPSTVRRWFRETGGPPHAAPIVTLSGDPSSTIPAMIIDLSRVHVCGGVFPQDVNDPPPDRNFPQARAFVELKAPRTKAERLVCLVWWATRDHRRDVRVSDLDELNREVGGDVFIDAGSVAQYIIEKGYLSRSRPGHVALTAEGEELTRSLPENHPNPTAPTIAPFDRTLVDLLDAGVIRPGEPIEWRRPGVGQHHHATIVRDGIIVVEDGRSFSSLSTAASALAGGSYNGWACWTVPRLGGVHIGSLRG